MLLLAVMPKIKPLYSLKYHEKTGNPTLDEIYKRFSRIQPISKPNDDDKIFLFEHGYDLLAQGVHFEDYGNQIISLLKQNNPSRYLDIRQVRAARTEANLSDKQVFVNSVLELKLNPKQSQYALDLDKYILEMAKLGITLPDGYIASSESIREALRALFTDLSKGQPTEHRSADFNKFTGGRGLQFLNGRIKYLLEALASRAQAAAKLAS